MNRVFMVASSSPVMIHAKLRSVGGGVLIGTLIMLSVLVWIAWRESGPLSWFFLFLAGLSAAFILYVADAARETLVWNGRALVFSSLLRSVRAIDVCRMQNIKVLYEGFNLERGMISIHFQDAAGDEGRLPLGPLWRWRELETFFHVLESASKECEVVRFRA